MNINYNGHNWDKDRFQQGSVGNYVKRGRYNGQDFATTYKSVNLSDFNDLPSYGNDALAFQKWYNDHYGNETGYIKEDGYFGNETMAAYNFAKQFINKTTPADLGRNVAYNPTSQQPQTITTPAFGTYTKPSTEGYGQINRAGIRNGDYSNQGTALLNKALNNWNQSVSNYGSYSGNGTWSGLLSVLNHGRRGGSDRARERALVNGQYQITKGADGNTYLRFNENGLNRNTNNSLGYNISQFVQSKKNGGMITKFQNGGAADEQAALAYLIKGLQASGIDVDPNDQNSIMQAVQQYAQQSGMQPQQAMQQLIQMGQQAQTQSAKKGAKLQYLKYLTGICPEGTEVSYHKVGGVLCKKCVQKDIEAKKCGGKAKPKKKINISCNGSAITKHQKGGALWTKNNKGQWIALSDKAGVKKGTIAKQGTIGIDRNGNKNIFMNGKWVTNGGTFTNSDGSKSVWNSKEGRFIRTGNNLQPWNNNTQSFGAPVAYAYNNNNGRHWDRNTVMSLQDALNKSYGTNLKVDGIIGPQTLAAMQKYGIDTPDGWNKLGNNAYGDLLTNGPVGRTYVGPTYNEATNTWSSSEYFVPRVPIGSHKALKIK